MSDLKTCPFCGDEAYHYAPGPVEHHIACSNYETCGADIKRNTEAEAIAAWNTRADDNEDVVTCFNCGARIDMLGMFTPLAKSSVLYRHYATYCPACGERLEQ